MTRLTLVISTLGRTQELHTLIGGLATQTMQDFDVLVVDQNKHDALKSLEAVDWPFPFRRIWTPDQSGASVGRNTGWRAATGDIILFPDDDCWYPDDLFARSLDMMDEHGADILCGRATDMQERSINGRFSTSAGPVDRASVWTTQIEWMMFFRRSILEEIDGYDETVGVGAATPWQACEGQDIALRALERGARIWYDPAICGHHAELDTLNPDSRMTQKGRGYARGMGHVLRKHHYSPLTLLYWSARPLAPMLVSAAKGNLRRLKYLLNVSLGRIEGYLGVTFGR